MTETLRDIVRLRLEKEEETDWGVLVLAALEGESALAGLLDGAAPRKPRGQAAVAPPAAPAAPTSVAYLKSITVEGFRGIGPRAVLDIEPGPGLTLVVGRNGSGKSSFAEGLEMALTGDIARFRRAAVWREGWENLHHKARVVAAELLLEGEKAPCRVSRAWADGAELDAAPATVQIQGKPRTDLDALGWTRALENNRPILSYSELGGMLEDGPSVLFDALNSILGLDAITDALDALKAERLAREGQQKDVGRQRELLAQIFARVDDARARDAEAALQKKDWGLDALDALIAAEPSKDGAESELQRLAKIATLAGPDAAAVAKTATDLRQAKQRLKATEGTLAVKAAALAEILDKALRFHDDHGDGDCPVCGRGRAMDAKWHGAQKESITRLRNDAKAAHEAQTAVQRAVQQARTFALAAAATLLKDANALSFKSAPTAADALAAWQQGLLVDDLEALASHLDARVAGLAAALKAVADEASAERQRREDVWRPVAVQLAAWLPGARQAREAAASVPLIKKAEKWLKDAEEDIRNERLAPIAESAKALCRELLRGSNVALDKVYLAGSGTKRRVEMGVTVDGSESAALGVMSQGELNSLALSLFIPRATLPESPFRFIVVDDPVQSMDASRVEGLARVLQQTATERQVVVFTHDDRLPEAVRRLAIPAILLEVTRREGSVVEIRRAQDPVGRYIDDALAVARTDALPREAAGRVVPGLCREALEAACMEALRRRRLGRGESHADVEELLEKAKGLKPLMALTLFDDADRGGDVLARLNTAAGRSGGEAFRICNEGAHAMFGGDMVMLIRDAEKLARWVQKQ
jgi:energy-coupling factor transporter ATP-binding protein EcfA2